MNSTRKLTGLGRSDSNLDIGLADLGLQVFISDLVLQFLQFVKRNAKS